MYLLSESFSFCQSLIISDLKVQIYRNKKESYPNTVSICQNKVHQSLFIHPHLNLENGWRCSPC